MFKPFTSVALLAVCLLLTGCLGGGTKKSKRDGGEITQYTDYFTKIKFRSADVDKSIDKGLVKAADAPLYKVQVDNTLQEVTFEVEDKATGVVFNQTFSIKGTKDLNKDYTAIKFSDYKTVVLNNSTGEIFDMEAASMDEMQMDGDNLYYLNGYQLARTDLTQGTLIADKINDMAYPLVNTGFSSAIYSSLNSSSSPFRFLGFSQYGASSPWASPSFVFVKDNLNASLVAAMSGPSGGQRVALFEEGQDAWDCQSFNLFTNVAGGGSGGVIQTADKNLYQVEIGNSLNCGLPGVYGCGDRVVRLDFAKAGSCWSKTTIVDLGVNSNFSTSTHPGVQYLYYKTNYQLADVERYVLNTAGFLKTEDDGSGGVDMTWTNLDLSALPTNSTSDNPAVVVEGDYVYWKNGQNIYRQELASATIPVFFTASPNGNVASFEVVQGMVLFVDAGGSTWSVETPNGAQTLVPNKIDTTSVVKFKN